MPPTSPPPQANKFVEHQLASWLTELETKYAAHCLTIVGPLYPGVDEIIRNAVEQLSIRRPRQRKLIVLLTTGGGYVEITHRIVETLRRHYRIVDFIVPDHAMSAGTVLVMSGDAIHMDYFSRLGPIDPQVSTPRGRSVSALGYLNQYERLIQKARDRKLTTVEASILLNAFDQGELYQYERARDFSIALLKQWLVKYKFKDWKVTQSKGVPVTLKMKRDRAEEIAKILNDTDTWFTHGHGISMTILQRRLKLLINDFEIDKRGTSDIIRNYHSLLMDYMSKVRMAGVIHTVESYVPYMSSEGGA